MTMDNGEGRPLDAEEAGADDPQAWYFDLPGGAWERQEEKNRTLRDRVAGNISEEAEKAKSDPFARRIPEPEPPSKGGFFGFGRKKKQSETPRESAGGTWAVTRGSQTSGNPQDEEAGDGDDWSTELPLRAEPQADLTLRRRTPSENEDSWGPADGGWSLGGDAEDDAAFTSEEDQDFRERMQFWARGAQSEATPLASEPDFEEEPAVEAIPPAQIDIPASRFAAVDDGAPGAGDGDFLASMRSWASGGSAGPGAGASDAPDHVQPPASDDVMQLPAPQGGPPARRLDWNAAYMPPEGDAAEQAVPEEPVDMLESMRKWAEQAKEAEHKRFALQHHEPEEVEPIEPPVIPLRPRHHDETDEPMASSGEPEEPGRPDEPPVMPLVLRPRQESQPVPDSAAGSGAPTKWDEFFGLDAPPSSEGEREGGLADGLDAMRDWAKKRPEAEGPRDIPEEFLKPFDWEDREATQATQATEAASSDEAFAELAQPFAWERAPQQPQVEGAALEIFESARADQPGAVTWPPAAMGEQPSDVDMDDEDPLAGIFDHPRDLPAPTKTKGGLFGRLFGRKPKDAEPEAAPLDLDEAQGDWVLPGEDDSRTLADRPSPAWAEIAPTVEDSAAPAEEAPSEAAEPLRVVAFDTAGVDVDGDSDGDWVPAEEIEPAVPAHQPVPMAGLPDDSTEIVAENDWEPVDDSEDGFVAAVTPPSDAPLGELEGANNDEFSWSPEPVTYEEPDVLGVQGLRVDDVSSAEAPEFAAPAPLQLSLEAFGQASAVGSTVDDEVAIEPVAETPVADERPWWELPAVEDAEPVEAVASVEPEAETPVTDERPWGEQPETEESEPVEVVASVEPEVEAPMADERPWWEQPAVEDAEPVEAVASVEPVAETPVTDERPWWEQPETEAAEPVEAVASVEPDAETPVADERPWWEHPAVEDAEPVEAVASAEPVAETPVADERPWWEQPAVEDAEPVEAVASAEPIAETPVADERPWWEHPETEVSEPVEAVASVEPVAETPVADERPWWERPAVEDAEPVEAVASVEPVGETPVADERPWWEHPETEEAEPVEAVASVEPVAETPVADERPWWEQPETEESEPVEAVASVEPIIETPVADERPWWEQPAIEDAEPVEAVASVETVAETPVADERPWWEAPPLEETAPIETVASVEPVSETAVADDDDPWAEFVGGEPEAGPVTPPAAASLAASWTPPATPAAPGWTPPTPPAADDDMWGDIAAQAEEAAFAVNEGDEVDLATSLETQMAERAEAQHTWDAEDDRWERAPHQEESPAIETEDAEEDVILRAFERHAATPDPQEERATEEALAALFGQNAAEIVDQSSEEPQPRSFIPMTGFAPQRSADSFDGSWAPEPEFDERPAFGGNDGAGFLPPPWDVEEFEGGSGPGARQGSRTKTWIRELVETGLLALLVFLSVRASFQNFKVDGNSMYPTLEDGQFLIVNKLVYSEVDVDKLGKFVPFIDAGDDPKRNVFHGPQRGDIVVLQDPRKPETDLIKRVIGLPGETVEIVGGKVYINDMLLEEPYITAPWNDTKPKILIPEGEYYVLGDNRDNSLDSRSSQVGLVPKDLIIGKAMLSYWPRDKFGLAPNEGGSLADEKPVLTTKRISEN